MKILNQCSSSKTLRREANFTLKSDSPSLGEKSTHQLLSGKHLRRIVLMVAMISSLCNIHGIIHADQRVLTVVDHTWAHPCQVSILVKYNGAKAMNLPSLQHGNNWRSWTAIWDGLYLQIYSERNAMVTEGVWGYRIEFSTDIEGKNLIHPVYEPSDGKTAESITASDIIHGDEYWLSVLGSL